MLDLVVSVIGFGLLGATFLSCGFIMFVSIRGTFFNEGP